MGDFFFTSFASFLGC